MTAGDPITLRLTVTGRGNFDRVSSGLLTHSPDWKSYKPVARFAPADSIGSEGTKTFEQAVVPLQAGHIKIPPLSFSYFDPETAKYVTRTTTPLAIDVAPVANPSATAPAAAPTGNVGRPEFAPNRVEPGQFTSTLQPLFLQPRFLIANASCLGQPRGGLLLLPPPRPACSRPPLPASTPGRPCDPRPTRRDGFGDAAR